MNKTYLIGAIIAASILIVATSMTIGETQAWPTASDRCSDSYNSHSSAGQIEGNLNQCNGYSDDQRLGRGGGDHPKA
jgi:hypothetical protein